MKIGLVDVDSHRWPNLCLMKLSAYHKARGNIVEWWRPEGRYDLVYKSRVFTDTYSKDTITVTNADQVICGGTGYGPGPNLPDAIEHSRPDYSLYPQFPEVGKPFPHEEELKEKSARLAELDTLLNIDQQPSQQEEAVEKSERPSVLSKLREPPPVRGTPDKPFRKEMEVR